MRLRKWFYWILMWIMIIFVILVMELSHRPLRRILQKSHKRSDIIISNIKKSLKPKE